MNLGKVARQVLGTVGPTLLTALAGPFAPMAIGILHAALGTNGDEKAADAALATATPDTLLKVKQAEAELQTRMAELGIQKEQLVFQDIANARAMQVSTRDPTASRLAWLVIGGFIGLSLLLAAACFIWPDRAVKISTSAAWTLLVAVVTYLSAEAKQAGAFYFGSSQSSQAKDATLAEIAKQS